MKAGRITNRGIICNIELNPNHAPPDQFVTLAHELAHLFCGHIGKFKGLCEDRRSTCHDSAEIEAEATAYLVSQRYGIQSNSETYLSAYVKGAKFSLDAVLVAAGKIQGMCSNTFRPKKEKVPL